MEINLTSIIDWIITNSVGITLTISVISLILSLYTQYTKWRSERIQLDVEIKKTTKLTTDSKSLMVEVALVNTSKLPTTILNLNLSIDNTNSTGRLHDENQIFIQNKTNPDRSVYITNTPLTIQALASKRVWMRFNFDEKLPDSLQDQTGKIEIVCFNSSKKHNIVFPNYTDAPKLI